MTEKPSTIQSTVSHQKKAADPRTLFVKFYPPSACITRQHLSDHFSNYGPVNRCSVIRQSNATSTSASQDESAGDNKDQASNHDRGSKGYGFVRFVHEEDAKLAADTISKKTIGGTKKKPENGEIMTVDGVHYRIYAERAVDAAAAESKIKGRREEGMKVSVKQDTGTKTLDPLTSVDDAVLAKRKRSSRVIIRNLSFYANENHVKTAMESNFGPVLAVDLPLVPTLTNEDGNKKNHGYEDNVPRHRGFAFVTFTNAASAKKAVEKGSEIKIKNRLVAIDFSISKIEHQKIAKERERDDDRSQDTNNKDDVDDENSEDKSQEDCSDTEDEEAIESKSDHSNSGENTDSDTENSTPVFDESESKRTLFLRNVPFDATRHDIFQLFREFGRVDAIYLVKDKQTGVFRGTAFVRFQNESSCHAVIQASTAEYTDDTKGLEPSNFVSSKNLAIGMTNGSNSYGLSLKGRHILVDFAVDRTTASSLAVQRDADGKPVKKLIGKDRRNLYLKNEGRVSSAADSTAAASAGAKYGGTWEDLSKTDRMKRERAFADKSTKLRSPLFFISPTRLSIRNLAKHVNESDLRRLVIQALKTGIEKKLVQPKDAVAHWRAGGELAQSEVMRRATDPMLVTPPFNEKNTKESIPSVFIDRDLSGGKKTKDAPSRGFGFVEFTHHTHALACLRQLNNNPTYSAEFAAGGKRASELLKQMHRKGKKHKKVKLDEEGADFIAEDGKVCVPRLIVEFAVENKVKAKQQAENIIQKKANIIKQKIEHKEKSESTQKKEKMSRGARQREAKRARNDDDNELVQKEGKTKSTSSNSANNDTHAMIKNKERELKQSKPAKRQKIDVDDDQLEDLIRNYKSSFSNIKYDATMKADEAHQMKSSRESVVKRRWFE